MQRPPTMTVSHSLRISLRASRALRYQSCQRPVVLGAVTGELGGVNRIAGAGEAHGHEAHLGGGAAQTVQQQDANLATGDADGWCLPWRCWSGRS